MPRCFLSRKIRREDLANSLISKKMIIRRSKKGVGRSKPRMKRKPSAVSSEENDEKKLIRANFTLKEETMIQWCHPFSCSSSELCGDNSDAFPQVFFDEDCDDASPLFEYIHYKFAVSSAHDSVVESSKYPGLNDFDRLDAEVSTGWTKEVPSHAAEISIAGSDHETSQGTCKRPMTEVSNILQTQYSSLTDGVAKRVKSDTTWPGRARSSRLKRSRSFLRSASNSLIFYVKGE